MKKNINYFALFALILFLIFSASCQKSSKNSGRVEVSGLIEAIKTEIRAQTQGEVKQILVEEGQKIHQGDFLCLLDDEKLNIQLNQVRAGIDGAKSKLKFVQKGTKKELIAMAKNQVAIAEKELDLAQKNQERMARLFSEGAISQNQKEQADLRLTAAQEQKKSAEENYQMALRGREKEEIEMVEAELRNFEAQEKFLLRQIQDSKVISPIPGLLEVKHIEVGELAAPGTLLFSLIDLNRTYVKAYVPEKYIGQIKIGNAVEVISDSFPGKTYKGKIDYISDEAEFSPKNIQTKEERLKLVYMIKSYIENSAGELKPGMPVDVRIVL
jgi:HlyD family secretion protein